MSELFELIEEEAVDAARRIGAGVVAGYDIARSIQERLRRDLGPGSYYIPGEDKVRRDRRIRQAVANGTDLDTVCRAFGLSRWTVRRILKQRESL